MPIAAQRTGESLKEETMPLTLPVNPNLEHLKFQAKALLRSARAGDQVALERFRSVNASEPKLSSAQFIIAAEYGFLNWARLKTYVATLQFQPLRSTLRRMYIHQLMHNLL